MRAAPGANAMDLCIDLDALRASARALAAVCEELDRVPPLDEDAAAATGHPALAARVRESGLEWTIARARLRDRVTFLADAIVSIADTHAELDRDLARRAAATGPVG